MHTRRRGGLNMSENGGVRSVLRGIGPDFQVGMRLLRKHPGLTAVAVLAMAFAIALAAITSEFFAQIIVPELPIEGGDRVVAIVMQDAASQTEEPRILMDFESWRAEARTIEYLGAYRLVDSNLILGAGRGAPVAAAEISASAFRVAAQPPLLGRTLVDEDEQFGSPSVMVISHEVWTARFDADPGVIGTEVRLGTSSYTIVGVMPEGFGFPIAQRAWVPFRSRAIEYNRRQGPGIRVFGRLAPGISLDEAQAELSAFGQRAAAESPETHQHLRPVVMSLPHSFFKFSTSATYGLATINLLALCLLALVCGNVALLLFARAATRQNEMVVRAALGATAARLVGQLFIEALVLAGVAAVIGVVAAQVSLRWVFEIVSTEMFRGDGVPFWFHASLSPQTVVYAVLLAVFAAAINGLLPGLKVTRGLSRKLKEAGPYGAGLRFGGVWTVLIVAQVAVTSLVPVFLFIIGGGAREIRAIDVGFPTEEYLTATIEMDRQTLPNASPVEASASFMARYRAAWEELERRWEREPAVAGVTFADRLPLMSHPHRRIELDGGEAAPVDEEVGYRRVSSASVSLDFFDVVNAPVLMGRGFDYRDLNPEALTVIVNQAFVDRILGGINPIGRRFRYVYFAELDGPRSRDEPWYEIVGVVRNMGMARPWDPATAGIYQPLLPALQYPVRVAVHVREDPLEFASRMRSITTELDPGIQLQGMNTLDQANAETLRVYDLLFWLTIGLSSVAMLLSLMGIHAVLSFIATQRTREMGICIALGGQPRRVAAAVFRRQLSQVVFGILVGVAFAAILARLHWIPILAYGSVILLVCSVATIIPVRRALRVQPNEALRGLN
jgi:predicted permease